MSKYLITTVETYRVESQKDAEELIAEAKKDNSYTLIKYSSIYKEKKLKGEVIDSWYRVILTKSFTEEKEPMEKFEVNYTNGAF